MSPTELPQSDRIEPSGGLLRFERFTTAGVSPEHRHEAWAARGFPSISALFASTPLGDFDTTAEWIRLDGVTVQYSTGTARLLERSAARIAADGIGMLGVGVQLEGDVTGDADGTPIDCRAGDVLLLDMARPSRFSLPAGRSIQLAIPYARVAKEVGVPAALHGTSLPATRAALLLAHLDRLRTNLPKLAVDHERRVARTIVDLLALALDDGMELPASGDGDGTEPRASIARRAIERSLGSRALDVTFLCQQLGVSRSVLYQEFRGEGGVQAYIRQRRLERVRAALLDPDNRTRIADLAYRWGFAGESHLSRQFRAAYGAPPNQFRRAAHVRAA